MLDNNNKRYWESKLNLSLLADRMTTNKSTSKCPFEVVYGKQARLPLENLLPVYKFVMEEDLFDPMEDMFVELVELDGVRKESKKYS